MNIALAPLLAPISESAPAGEDTRSTDDYEVVSSEIDKMISLSGATPVDWALVERQGADMLAGQSKDFMLAAWVSAAWMERYGLEGLHAGLELHAGLIENYWETAFPPLKRLRGRRNALSWWLERAADWLEAATPPPLDTTTHAAMLDAVTRIDKGLAEHDPESPPLGSFVQRIRNLDVLAAPEAAAESAPVPDTSPDNAAAAPPAAVAAPASTAPAQTAPAPVAPPPAQATPGTAAALPVLSLPENLATLDDVIDALQPVKNHLGQIGSALLEIDRFQPLVIDINRFAARAALLSAPPATAGTTALAAPPVAILDAFQTVCGAGNADGIVAFCESRILAFPFWLDLDRQSARGFGMLGEPGAPMRQAVINNALAFTERLPDIERLAFSDGTPFADDETLEWLEACRAQNSGAAPADAFSGVEQQARAAANDGRHEQAMQLYQSLVQASRSGRDRFRAHIGLIELLLAAQGDIDPMPFAQPLLQECNRHDLAEWEPELAAQAWQTVLKACRQALANPAISDDADLRRQYQQARHDALQQLARLDFPAAARFS